MDREKIVKMVVTLAAVIVIAVSLGKILGRNSMSLSEYARLNGGESVSSAPSHEQGDEAEDGDSMNPNDSHDGSQPSSDSADSKDSDSDPVPTAPSGEVQDDPVPSSLIGATLNGDSQLEQRVSLEEGFYYEPISDNLRRYMTGVSFPAESSSAEDSETGNFGKTASPEKSTSSPDKDPTGKNSDTAASPGKKAAESAREDAGQPPSLEETVNPAQDDAEDAEESSSPGENSREEDPDSHAAQENAEPEISFDDLRYVHILHIDFNGNPAEGELVCNELIAADLAEIFLELYRNEYRLEKVLLIDEYEGDDTASMEDNNTSCFNYRTVDGTERLSKHAYGLAIDVNPLYNPYITYTEEGGEQVSPASALSYADRSLNFPYKITEDDLCYRLFTQHGFIWGGNWNDVKDYQHFQKTR